MDSARKEGYAPIHVRKSTKLRFLDFANAMRMTHDEALSFIIDSMLHPGEDAMLAGRRIRMQIEEEQRESEAEKRGLQRIPKAPTAASVAPTP